MSKSPEQEQPPQEGEAMTEKQPPAGGKDKGSVTHEYPEKEALNIKAETLEGFTQNNIEKMHRADCGCQGLSREQRGRMNHTQHCKFDAEYLGRVDAPRFAPWGSSVSVFKKRDGTLMWDGTSKFDNIWEQRNGWR